MKIICAGMSKTGTKSMNRALTMLGYSVYDYFENLEEFGEEWAKIANNEVEPTELLRKMYKNVDAGTDMPIYCYWEELLEAFPDAKVILMVRDNEDDFCKSMINQIKNNEASTNVLFQFLSPSFKKMMDLNMLLAEATFGRLPDKPFQFKITINKMVLKQAYRRHNAYVKECCPKDQLLVFNCKEGWDPLCEFLNLPVPKEPFPHRNIKGEIVKELLETNMFKRIRREFLISSVTLVLMFGATSYWGYKKWTGA